MNTDSIVATGPNDHHWSDVTNRLEPGLGPEWEAQQRAAQRGAAPSPTERALAEKGRQLDQLEDDLNADKAQLDAERAQLAREQAAARDAIDREAADARASVERDRAAIEAARQELEEARAALEALREAQPPAKPRK